MGGLVPGIAPLEPPYADQAGAQLASMMPAGAPPVGLFRVLARHLPMTSAMHGWGRYELGRQLTLTMLVHGGPQDQCWPSQQERLLILAVDALHESADVGDGLWARLAPAFGERQLLDLLLLCGWYHAVSFAARAARVPYEPGAPRFADVLPGA